MKILMALDYYRPNVSGLTLYVEHLAEGLAARGHDVSVLTHRHLPELPPESRENGVRIVRAPVGGRLGKALIAHPTAIPRAVTEIGRADVVHLHSPLVRAVGLSTLAATLRVPVVVTYHCDLQPPAGLLHRFVELVARVSQNFALDRAERAVTYTEDYARHTRALADRIEKVGWILPPVTDPPDTGRTEAQVRERYGVRGEPVLLFLGRFAEEKGLFFLLEAHELIRKRFPGAALVLAGENKLVPGETVGERLAPLLADPNSGVVATGIVRPDSIADLFTMSDVLVLPSINSTESFGLVQVEAMLRGVPVVASNLPGVRQPARMTGMGEIAPIGDSEGLAKQILRVLESPDRYFRPRAEIRAMFSLDRTLADYESVYSSAMGGSTSRAGNEKGDERDAKGAGGTGTPVK
jgi:glycosyltransferase involved in cell wall biosynthesis